MAIDTTTSRTRRAILLGALGGVAASVAAAVAHVSPATAADGDIVHVGRRYHGDTLTRIDTSDVVAFVATSTTSYGISGASGTSHGVAGNSTSGNGVDGYSNEGIGVYGANGQTYGAGVFGSSYGGNGVIGISQLASDPASPPIPHTGVYGVCHSGRGGVFTGSKAQVRLTPSTAATHPSSGAVGDLFLDRSARLWLCKGGTTWVNIA